ncbi:hypothetical protein [Mesorhizobium sp.]|uniref:hypothetical protein n=2 Tax=unclassified Mesorhizobium TaxID=325217 RepID=UPI0026A69CB4
MADDFSRKAMALVKMTGGVGRTFGHGAAYDADLHAELRPRYPSSSIGHITRPGCRADLMGANTLRASRTATAIANLATRESENLRASFVLSDFRDATARSNSADRLFKLPIGMARGALLAKSTPKITNET